MDDRGQPAFDEAPRQIAPGSDPRRLYAVIVVLVGVIVVLLIRPWGDGTERPPNSGQATQGAPADGGEPTESEPSTAAPADPYAALRVTCGSPSGWRAATLQEWAGRSTPIRSWIAIEPVPAAGALDPAIPFAPVATGIVTAIGYCAPLDDAERPPAVARASLWAIRDGTARALTLLPLEPERPDALGGLWAPPPEVGPFATAGPGPSATASAEGDRVALWPPGRYAVEIAAPDAGYDRWLGIEIADLSLLRASPSVRPSGSPSPDGSASPGAPAAPSSPAAP